EAAALGPRADHLVVRVAAHLAEVAGAVAVAPGTAAARLDAARAGVGRGALAAALEVPPVDAQDDRPQCDVARGPEVWREAREGVAAPVHAAHVSRDRRVTAAIAGTRRELRRTPHLDARPARGGRSGRSERQRARRAARVVGCRLAG